MHACIVTSYIRARNWTGRGLKLHELRHIHMSDCGFAGRAAAAQCSRGIAQSIYVRAYIARYKHEVSGQRCQHQ